MESGTLRRIDTWYLPVTEFAASAFITHGAVPEASIERAALLAMMLATQRPLGRGDLYRLVDEARELFDGQPLADGERDLLAQRVVLADMGFGEVAGLLGDQGVAFADVEVMAAEAWLGEDGEFSHGFQAACRETFMEVSVRLEEDLGADDEDGDVERPMAGDQVVEVVRPTFHLRGTTDQVRAVRAIAASSSEHYAITAFAGTGKTHLMFALATSGRRFTHLAPTHAHQHAFNERVGTRAVSSVVLRTLANDMATAHVQGNSIRWVRAPTVREASMPLEARLQAAGIVSIAGDSPARVLAAVDRIINRWCYSDAPQIGPEHVRFNDGLSVDERAAYVAMARRVWELMLQPLGSKTERPFTVRAYHLFKWLDVEGASLPPMGTLLIDEAHDLPAPLLALIRRYPDGCVTMGDPYQKLSGVMANYGSGKALTLTRSVRAGGQAVGLIRSVLDMHSTELVVESLEGSREHYTRRYFYQSTDTLPLAGLRVYGSVWSILEDALRLKSQGVPFRLLPATESDLARATEDAIGMRRGDHVTRYYGNREYTSWSALAGHLERIGYSRVVLLFERDFGSTDMQSLLGAQKDAEAEGLTLGLLEHCKSLEFSQVTLWPCCFDTLSGALERRRADERVRAVYLAMSRATDELWLPGDALDMLADRVSRGRGQFT
ncbi:AAA family ATPase [Luteibacter sp. 9133]|uniref:AAA family ATPase n=1 Tax=Luteibacter sp. 9133 TaxID=1500891 RepID=UPI0005BE289C|nr:AAA family ATPase [Luteibacter sp. 9133]